MGAYCVQIYNLLSDGYTPRQHFENGVSLTLLTPRFPYVRMVIMSTEKQLTVSTEGLGPAMAALNPRHRAFVNAMFDLGPDANYTQAAREAGYEGTPNSLKVQAHRIAHSDKVQAALREEAGRRAAGLLPLANAMMHNIMINPSHPDHLKAVKHAQSIAGLAPVTKIEVTHKNDTASLKADLLAAMDLLKSVAGPIIDVTPERTNDGSPSDGNPVDSLGRGSHFLGRLDDEVIENHSQDEDWIAT